MTFSLRKRRKGTPGSPNVRKLLALLKRLEIAWPYAPEITVIRRVYGSWNQRAAGAWSWYVHLSEEALRGNKRVDHYIPQIGSSDTLRNILRSKKVTVYCHNNDIELFDEDNSGI